ncbi:hypothetical protein ACFFX0_05920 [Citricoccus parietis]|uniref:Uncharacterized protein n=1 Tax=Citricoccus parietis TaxID=592307 RepID=A0ABV5FVQ9_9MICC
MPVQWPLPGAREGPVIQFRQGVIAGLAGPGHGPHLRCRYGRGRVRWHRR